MGCRICVLQASAEAMPLDLSMLLTPRGGATEGSSDLTSGQSSGAIRVAFATHCPLGDGATPYACRRVSSFPTSHKAGLVASTLKSRSSSETAVLQAQTALNCLTLEDIKRELISDKPPLHTHQYLSEPLMGEEEKRKTARRVQFADERGLDLASVRVMTEPSDVPPKLKSPVIRSLLSQLGACDEEARAASSWSLDFAQPASDYISFRQKVETQNVALENVVLRNEQCKMAGTVKVKNIAFEKKVFIRLTDNGWSSYSDKEATYQVGRRGDIYDTFSFDMEIPCDDEQHSTIEFCVCYRAGETEHWDSNGGKNFVLLGETERMKRVAPELSSQQQGQHRYPPYNDAMLIQNTNLAAFAAWKDLTCQGPYY